MVKSSITEIFKSNIETVWDVITNNDDFSWRSDLSKIEIIDNGNKFIEYTKDNFPTTFTITKKEEYKQYEFDIENKNMKGHWVGIFKQLDNETGVTFIEEVEVSNPVMKLLAKSYLKKQQGRYINDLKSKLQNK